MSRKISLKRKLFIKKTHIALFFSLLLMIASFFTWSENIVLTRIIKVATRMGMLLVIFITYHKLLSFGAVDNLKIKKRFPLYAYILYLALAFASFLWSSDIGVSALQWLMTMQTFVFTIYFVKTFQILNTFFNDSKVYFHQLLGYSISLILLLFIVGVWFSPDTFYRYTVGGEEARLGGYLMNPNELGMLAGIGIAALLFNFKIKEHKKWKTFFLITILFISLLATGSRSSLIGVLLLVMYHIKLSNSFKLKFVSSTLLLLLSPIAIYWVILKGGDAHRINEMLSMTGRLPFWKALISEGLPREPWLGFGYMRIDYNDYFQGFDTYPGKMTHNTFLQVLLNLGFIGFLIVLFQLFFTLQAVWKEVSVMKPLFISILIPLLINSITEFGVFGETNYGILFYQFIILFTYFGKNQHLTSQQKVYLKARQNLISKSTK